MVHWLAMSGADASLSLGLGRRPVLVPLGLLGAVAAFLATMAVLNAEGHTHFDVPITLAGLGVGFVIGLTGMGGGALMTPVLVIFFHVPASSAISSDIVASFFLKPIGGGVHIRKRTVNWTLVRWLSVGSVPAAFIGSYVIDQVAGNGFETRVKEILGAVLLLAAAAMLVKVVVQARRGEVPTEMMDQRLVRPIPTIMIGAFG